MNQDTILLPSKAGQAIEHMKKMFNIDNELETMIALTIGAGIVQAYDNFTVADYESLRSDIFKFTKENEQ